MHGFPPLLPGSRVMRFKRFMLSGYLRAGSVVKPRGLASPSATCRSALNPTSHLWECKPTLIPGTGIDNDPGLGDSDDAFRPSLPTASRQDGCVRASRLAGNARRARAEFLASTVFPGNCHRHTGYPRSSRSRCSSICQMLEHDDGQLGTEPFDLGPSVVATGHGQGRNRADARVAWHWSRADEDHLHRTMGTRQWFGPLWLYLGCVLGPGQALRHKSECNCSPVGAGNTRPRPCPQ